MSGRKRKLEITSPNVAMTPRIEVDREKCLLCQSTDSSDAIVSPFKSPCFLQNPEKSLYSKVTACLKQFQQIRNDLPTILQKTIENYENRKRSSIRPCRTQNDFA